MSTQVSSQGSREVSRVSSKPLAGQVAVVTGASKGIGAAIARQLAGAGASVVVNYAASKDGAQRVVDAVRSVGGSAIAVQADVAKQGDVERLFREVDAAFGRLDILVNNAGVYEFVPLEAITEAHFHRHFDTNVLGLLLASREAVTRFGPEGGTIINISSIASTMSLPNAAVYSASKASVDAITRSLAAELGPRKIRVNAINPGVVETEGTRAAGVVDPESEFRRNAERTTPLGRIGQPDDIGSVAVFLASKDSAWVTGETLRAAGGFR